MYGKCPGCHQSVQLIQYNKLLVIGQHHPKLTPSLSPQQFVSDNCEGSLKEPVKEEVLD